MVEILFSTPGDSWYGAKKKYLGWFWPLQELQCMKLLKNEKFYVHKKSGHFFGASKLANFVLQRVRHIILGQNERIKKYVYLRFGLQNLKKSKNVEISCFSPIWEGQRGGNSPKWPLIIFLYMIRSVSTIKSEIKKISDELLKYQQFWGLWSCPGSNK